jgi:hypothetical protein
MGHQTLKKNGKIHVCVKNMQGSKTNLQYFLEKSKMDDTGTDVNSNKKKKIFFFHTKCIHFRMLVIPVSSIKKGLSVGSNFRH